MQDSVLERMLIALRDRIPRKLEQEGLASKTKGREKTQVDVFRGSESAGSARVHSAACPREVLIPRYLPPARRARTADYQMAFFFRKSSDKHVVLLKVSCTRCDPVPGSELST